MKKTLLALLLVLCMLVTFTAFTASAEETEAVPEETAETATHTHCVCGGSAVGVHDHQCADIVWTPLSEALTGVGLTMQTADFGKLPSGNYYLDGDVTVANDTYFTNKQQINICLNGHSISVNALGTDDKAQGTFGYLQAGAQLAICDCSGKQDANGNWTWDGTITGGTRNYGGVCATNANSRLFIYGGNYVGVTGTSGVVFNVCKDAYAAAGGNSTDKQYSPGLYSELYIYNGHITGGTATNQGGVINVWHTSDVYIYGGTITGGTAPKGGNIFLANGYYLIAGGTISNGTATTGYGGNIHSAAGTLEITGGTISGGNAKVAGGNIYTNKLTMSGGTITAGTAQSYDSSTEKVDADYGGGNIYLPEAASATISGGTISNGTSKTGGANIQLMKSTNLTITGGTVSGGTAASGYNGGNIRANYNSATMNIGVENSTTGPLITGGKANSAGGGNLYFAGKLNIYSGTISNGEATSNGGNIYTGANGKLTMTGGTISGGLAKQGGNIYSQCDVELSGGVVTGGRATSRGGNIYQINTATKTLTIKGTVQIKDGQARVDVTGTDTTDYTSAGTNYGGNIYLHGSSSAVGHMVISGGTISGGSANIGGNIYSSGTVEISGGTIIGGQAKGTDATGGNLYLAMTRNGATILTEVTMTGGTISGGKAKVGGNMQIHGQFTMTGGTITGGEADSGATVRVFRPGNFVLDGGTVEGGTAKYGGTFYLAGSVPTTTYKQTGTLTVKSGTISGGTATSTGGSIYITSFGELYVEGGTITGGTSTSQGGNIYVGSGTKDRVSKLAISGGTISNGTSNTSYGGNIYVATPTGEMDLSITGGKIAGGKALKSNGGNIYLNTGNTLTVSGSTIIENGTSLNAGGNIYSKSTLTLEGEVIVSGGTSTGSSSGNIYSSGTLTLKDNVQIKDGSAVSEGGNIANYGTLVIQDNALISGGQVSSATGMGGNIHSGSGKTLTITGGTITGGTAKKQGGNLCLAGDAEISGLTVSNGTADGITDGKSSGIGGNIYISGSATVTLTDCTITGGTAGHQGGSIYASGKLNLVRGSVTGGIADHDHPVKDAAGNLTGDTATTSGGNIYAADTLSIDGTTVSGGQATHGGNITLVGKDNIIKNAIIFDGVANLMSDGTTNGNGGNIYSISSATTTITDCTITGGVGRRGGSVGAWGQVTIENTTITGGEAIYNGGNIMTYGSGQLTLKAGTVLSGGTAGDNGGAISFNSTAGKKHLIEDGVTIVSGTCEASPGIYVSGGDLTITGAPEFDIISFKGESDDYTWNIDQMTTPGPIEVTTTQPCYFATSATDRLDLFVNNQGYIKAYRDGKLYLDAPTAVYVSDNGSNSNPGTQSAPYLTVDHALDMLANNGTVNIVDKVTMESWDRHEKAATLTGGELDLTSSARLELGDSIHFKAMTITMPSGEYYIYCDGFKTVIDEDVTVRYFDGTNYTTTSSKSYIYGGGRASYAKEHGAFTGTDLTVLSGVWGFIYGGNNQDVDMTGDVHLTVGGNVNKGVDYATAGHSSSTNGYNLVFGGSRSADINGTVYMTITGNAIANSFHGGSNGETHVDNIELTVSGGEGMALYGAGRGGAQTVGQITVNYNGGTFEQVFGGALKQDLTGNVELYLNGGKITRRIYGGCYNDTSGLNFATEHQVTGDVTVYIGGVQITRELTQHSDRSIYGHSRCKATSTDAENSAIIFLNETAYNTYKDNLKYEDSEMGIFMYGVSAADNLHYYTYTASGDTLTRSCAYDSTESATAKIVLDPQVELIYRGEVVEPATVEYTNWTVLPVELVYSNNDRAGTASASITAGGQTATLSFTLENGALAQIGNAEYYTVQAAVDALEKNQYVKLVGNSDENVTVSSDLYLDLNGHSITGTVTVNEGATLYGMDSTTDDYDCTDGNGNDNYGTVKVVGAVEPYFKTSVTGSIRRYLTCTEAEGVFSFHRMYLGITHMSLRPGVVGVGYKAMFCGDEKVVNMLNETEAFGYRLWIEGVGEAQQFKARNEFESRKVVTLRLQNFDVEQYGEENIYAEVYMKLSDGTVIDSADYCYTLRSLLESINNNSGSYSEAQLRAIKAMCAPFAQFMQNANWAVSNLIG